MSRRLFVVVMLFVLAPSSLAAAQSGDGAARAGSGEVATLQAEIAREYEALSTAGCDVACRALASMQRAAARLCALDPGPKCADARAKVRDAANRVHTSCPGCALAADDDRPPPARSAREPAPAPPAPLGEAQRPRGGCAGCAVGDGSTDVGAAALALAWALMVLARRRRRDD